MYISHDSTLSQISSVRSELFLKNRRLIIVVGVNLVDFRAILETMGIKRLKLKTLPVYRATLGMIFPSQ